jgi:hypothetical protein
VWNGSIASWILNLGTRWRRAVWLTPLSPRAGWALPRPLFCIHSSFLRINNNSRSPGERVVVTHCICGWMGPEAGPVVLEEIDLVPLPEIEPRFPTVQPVV